MKAIESLPSLAPRRAESHKGDYGKVLVIGGSETMIGAPAFVALAALRTGSGLCRIAAPKESLLAILGVCPYATGISWGGRDSKALLEAAADHDVVAIGPGLGLAPGARKLVLDLLESHPGPLVLDADALNALATLEPSQWPRRRDWSNVVLTPHMGEFMRLIASVMKRGTSLTPATPPPPRRTRSLVDDEPLCMADGMPVEMPPEVQTMETKAESPGVPDNRALAELLSKGTGAVVLLKGHRTVVTDSQRYAINTTGNPAMATAGSGDVLTGVIASLIGQGLPPLEAAVLGAHLHGLAGDLALEKLGGGLLATDLIDALPRAMSR